MSANININITSTWGHITDSRLMELLPTVPEGVTVAFYGHIRTTQTGYGMWRVTVDLDINGSTEKYSFMTNDEEMKLVLEGADYREFPYTYAQAVDAALAQAIEENYGELYGDLKLATITEEDEA